MAPEEFLRDVPLRRGSADLHWSWRFVSKKGSFANAEAPEKRMRCHIKMVNLPLRPERRDWTPKEPH